MSGSSSSFFRLWHSSTLVFSLKHTTSKHEHPLSAAQDLSQLKPADKCPQMTSIIWALGAVIMFLCCLFVLCSFERILCLTSPQLCQSLRRSSLQPRETPDQDVRLLQSLPVTGRKKYSLLTTLQRRRIHRVQNMSRRKQKSFRSVKRSCTEILMCRHRHLIISSLQPTWISLQTNAPPLSNTHWKQTECQRSSSCLTSGMAPWPRLVSLEEPRKL